MPPKLQLGAPKPVADEKTLEALIANRYEVMAGYARGVRQACKDEMAALKARHGDVSVLKAAKRWLHRDTEKCLRRPCPNWPRCVPRTLRWTPWSPCAKNCASCGSTPRTRASSSLHRFAGLVPPR